MDMRVLRRIIKEFEKSSLSKLEITENDLNIKLEKDSHQTKDQVRMIESYNQPIVQETKDDYYVLESPLVGTFYEASSPDAAPFVRLNQRVEKGEVLFIIEAMKVMNEIKSPISGVIKKIHVLDGQSVEFAQKIMEIEE
ncbi:MAG: acetyl-CoA carboxylase, biotin carboxyl carrier protein [Tenericutes bacterium HGW-Tenericutes-5]|jgi:acetyl-CoA carboxylase biotin carboxyl carrier protein|nr:MAG: acetyl-CoA carboxylase, biotin carboxyl carrier protein [Tenericutes bacterium HGW-Tenericutes-5]PKK96062.1 MAG: acetyl-CoA carboxylase, biotin carboxyl carrier protein [Tenericutes bacterium HGW-Tenericutes-4]